MSLAYIRRDGDERGIHYSNGRRGPAGEIRTAAWSPDGTQVVFHKRVTFERKPWVQDLESKSAVRVDAHWRRPVVQPGG